MILAAAQTNPSDMNTNENIQQHLLLIDKAFTHGVQLIVFPEMSLTGYEREKAIELAFITDDIRVEVFKEKSKSYGMIIIVGAPVLIQSKLYIGSFIFQPDGSVCIYTKQFLHDGEEQFFSPGMTDKTTINIGEEKIAIAVCADITNPLHPANAFKNHANLYIASLFYTPDGIDEAYQQLSRYAGAYKMNVLMSNYCGYSYGLRGAGQSAFWNKDGILKGKLTIGDEEGLLIINSNQEATFLPFSHEVVK